MERRFFQFSVMSRRASQISFVAARSLGKWPLRGNAGEDHAPNRKKKPASLISSYETKPKSKPFEIYDLADLGDRNHLAIEFHHRIRAVNKPVEVILSNRAG
jgi:hypothetical protein